MNAEPINAPQLSASLTDDKLGIVLMLNRGGVRAFLVFLEHNLFPPHDPELNKKLSCVVLKWVGVEWVFLTIPLEYREQVEKQASDLGLRIVQGHPAAFTHKGREEFPIQVPNLYVVEHVRGHFIYKGDPETGKTADDAEREAVLKFLSDYDEKHSLPPAE